MFAEEPLGESDEGFAGFREDEAAALLGPIQFEAGGLGGDPDLPDGRIGSEDEFAGAVFEEDIEDAVLLFGLEATCLFGGDEGLLEIGEGLVGFAAEGGFVDGGHP